MNCASNHTPLALEPLARDGFIDLFQQIRARVEDCSSALTGQDDLQLRRQRLQDIVRVIDAFGMAPTWEIEAHALRTLGRDLEEMLVTLRAYICTGVEDSQKLQALFPGEREQLKAMATRLESWGLFWQANLLYATDQYREAMSSFQRILAHDPEFPRRDAIYTSLGMAWEHIVVDLERAEAMYSELVTVRRARLEALIQTGMPIRGEDDLPVVGVPGQLELTPLEAAALALERRGDLRMKRSAWGPAAADFKEAAELRGEDPVARRKLYRARFRQFLWPFGRSKG